MAVADEVRRRLQFKCITFEGLEALARVCDTDLPTDDDILKAGVKTTGQFLKMTELSIGRLFAERTHVIGIERRQEEEWVSFTSFLT